MLREGKKIFSLPIATRDRYLHEAVPAAWQPVLIETFEDNMASKMTALVERGAPRDLRDVHEVCSRSLVSVNDCWALYRLKHPAQDAAVAADKVLFAIERLDLQRPLATIADTTVREQAGRLRTWYRDVFCPAGRL